MMSTGAASARVSLAQELDEHYPVDLMVDGTVQGDDASLPADVADGRRRGRPASTRCSRCGPVPVMLRRRRGSRSPHPPTAPPRPCCATRAPPTGSTTGRCCCPKLVAEQATDGTIPVTAYATPWDDVRAGAGRVRRSRSEPVPSDLGGIYALVTLGHPRAARAAGARRRCSGSASTRAPTRRSCSRTSGRRCPTPRRR